MKPMNIARRFGARVGVFAAAVSASAMSFAAGTGIDAALDSVDLTGVSVKVGAAALLIVGIALVFKGPDLAKRVVRKV